MTTPMSPHQPTAPFLLNPNQLSGLPNDWFWLAGLMDLGQLASAETPTPGQIKVAERAAGKALVGGWRQLMAAEWLLAAVGGRKPMADALGEFAGERIFGPGGPTAKEVAMAGTAGVLIPLASQGLTPRPGLAALFLSRATNGKQFDHRVDWEGADDLLKAKGLRLFALRTPARQKKVDGPSWKLGAELAVKCLGADVPPATVLSLARDWLPTGDVDPNGHVVFVGIGDKVKLPTPKRRWLLASGQVMPVHFKQSHVEAGTLEIAWNHVLQQGTVEERANRSWPDGTTELHSFVSGAREPVIAAALLAQTSRLVLWRSRNKDLSISPSEDIRNILKKLRPRLKVEFADTVSDSMHRVEQDLRARLEAPLRKGSPILFNVTQGNRLMGFAVHTLARQHTSLWMVYRDLEGAGLDFAAIRYDGRDYPVTFALRTASDCADDVAWDELLRSLTPRSLEPWQNLLQRVWKKPGAAAS